MFSTIPNINFYFWVTFFGLSSANALNLNGSTFLSCGKEFSVVVDFTQVSSLVPMAFLFCNEQNYTLHINPLPEDKILDWSKFKQIADNI